MKNLKFLFVILAAFLILPIGVLADETTDGEVAGSNEVNVYFFHGNGCPHCEDASLWFEEIEEEYGDKFNLVAYEVWYNETNSKLMAAVAEARKETADGVPYIIVGNQSWSGFAEDYEDAILSKIESEYEQDPSERYDIMNYVDLTADKDTKETDTTKDVLVLLVLFGVVAAVAVGVVFARKNINQ